MKIKLDFYCLFFFSLEIFFKVEKPLMSSCEVEFEDQRELERGV